MYDLVGKQTVDFPDQKTGEQVQGIKLHFLAYDDNVFGKAAMTHFIRSNNPCYSRAISLRLGDFTVIYGPKGRIVDVQQDVPKQDVPKQDIPKK